MPAIPEKLSKKDICMPNRNFSKVLLITVIDMNPEYNNEQ